MVSIKMLKKLCLGGVIPADMYWQLKRNKRIQRKAHSINTFSLNSYKSSECVLKFRFTGEEIRKLLKSLKIPTICRLNDGQKYFGLEGICILLRRLAYPNRLTDIASIFGRDSRALSKIFNDMVDRIYAKHSHVFVKMQQTWLTAEKLKNFAQVTSAAGSAMPNIVGFIDGTARPICRPKYNQRDQYSGHKKCHVLKYQSVVFPNGIIGRLDGPFNGRRHDSAILHLSKILKEMEKFLANGDGTWYSLYGDGGYSNQKFIKVGYKNVKKLSAAQKLFNSDMSALRLSVEYGFGKILQQFAFLDFKKNQKLLLQNLKKQYYVAAILTNLHTCLRGCQVATYFDCDPPTLDEYLKN